MVKVLTSHQCGLGSNPGVGATCGLSLLLVLSFAPRGFSLGTRVFPSPQKLAFPNSNSTRNQVEEGPLCGCATFKSLLSLLLLIIIKSSLKNVDISNYQEVKKTVFSPQAQKEAAEAEEMAKEFGLNGNSSEDGLRQLILKRQSDRQGALDDMIAGLEAKYCKPKKPKTTKGKKK